VDRVSFLALVVIDGTAKTSSDSSQLEKIKAYLDDHPDVEGEPLGAGYQATAELYRTPFGDFVIKRARGPFLWRRLGESGLRRERDIYDRVREVTGIPRCIGLLDSKHLVLEHVPGDSYRQRQFELKDRERFFERLFTTIENMHAAGVAHGDLKRKDNLLVGPDERPFLIDFGLAYATGSGSPFERSFFRWVQQYDYNAWIKHKYQRRVEDISADDAKYYRPMKLELMARAIRVIWQKLTLRRYRTRNRVR
jgi:serine/threonine protein kinase